MVRTLGEVPSSSHLWGRIDHCERWAYFLFVRMPGKSLSAILFVLTVSGSMVWGVFESDSARASSQRIPNTGFESGGLSGWSFVPAGRFSGTAISSSGSGVSAVPGQVAITANVGGPVWTFQGAGEGTALLQPAGASVLFDNATSALGLSAAENSSIRNISAGTPTDAAWMTKAVTLSAGVTYTMAWNYVATDYVPFNDGSITSLVPVDGASTAEISVNNYVRRFALLGFTTPGTGDYSTGSYGSTGWQTSTYQVSVTGEYLLGFAVFNLDDMFLAPVLFVDDQLGTTTRNGQPFGAVAPNNPNAPTVPPPPPPVAQAPNAPTVVVGDGEVELEWNQPTSVDPIVDYTIRWSTTSAVTWSTPVETGGTTLSATVSGLENGTEYIFQVAAITAPGGTRTTGTWSASSTSVVPGAPVNITVPSIAGSPWVGQTLTVSDPDGNWRLPVTASASYQWRSNGSAIAGATGSALVVTDSLAGTNISVVASRTNDYGSASATSVVVAVPDIYLADLDIAEVPGQVPFDPNMFSYALNVGSAVTSINLTATASAGTSIMEINGGATVSGTTVTLPLVVGVNSTTISALSADRSVKIEYTLTVVRATPQVTVPPIFVPPPTTAAPTSTTTAPSSSTTAPPTSSPTGTTLPPVPPGVEPFRLENGDLPSLPTGVALAFENGEPVDVAVEEVSPLSWQMASSEFQWRLEIPADRGPSAMSPRSGVPRVVLIRDAEALVSGFGFEPGSTVEIWLFSEPVYLGSVLVGADGTFTGSVPVPISMTVGEHTLQANGRSSDGGIRSLSLGVEIIEPVVVELPVTGFDDPVAVAALFLLVFGALLWSRSRTRSLASPGSKLG